MLVLDASAAIEWLLGRPAGAAVAERLADPERTVHAPHLLTVEAAQVLRRYSLAGELTEQRGAQALTDLADLDVVLHEHGPLLPRIWRLRENVTAYDAVYLALSELLDAPLVTLDGRLARSTGHRAVIDHVLAAEN